MLKIQKELLILSLAMTVIAVALSLRFNAIIGFGVGLVGLVIVLMILRKRAYFQYVDENNGFKPQYKCMNCGFISISSFCKRCGGKISQFYSR